MVGSAPDARGWTRQGHSIWALDSHSGWATGYSDAVGFRGEPPRAAPQPCEGLSALRGWHAKPAAPDWLPTAWPCWPRRSLLVALVI